MSKKFYRRLTVTQDVEVEVDITYLIGEINEWLAKNKYNYYLTEEDMIMFCGDSKGEHKVKINNTDGKELYADTLVREWVDETMADEGNWFVNDEWIDYDKTEVIEDYD